MRKKDLIRNLDIANARIAALEDLICPARQHKWYENYEDEYRICLKCRKVVRLWLN